MIPKFYIILYHTHGKINKRARKKQIRTCSGMDSTQKDPAMSMERSFYCAYSNAKQNDKPGYVANDHLSRIIVADDLKRPT